MIGVREYFSSYQEEQMDFSITVGNRTKCTPVGRGTIAFQTEARANIRAINVLHVPRLGMNLISASQLQDKGSDVYFIGKKMMRTRKYAKATFSRSNNRAECVLGLIHSDICDPMSIRALSGGEYFITFIDDHSRKTWIYFLKTKDEVFDRFRDFKALIENMTRKKIKVLCSDNSGEYREK
eukprot:PITA_08584